MMKILIVSDRPNVPVTAGNRSFINSLVCLLLSEGHEVHFLFIEEPTSSESEDVASLKVFWKDRLHVYRISLFSKLIRSLKIRIRWWFCNSYYHCDDYYPRGLHGYVNKLDRIYGFDACFVNYYYLSKLFCKINIPRLGLITHDYFAYKNLLVGGKHIYLNTTAHQEAIAMQRSPHIFALNEEEAVYFKKISPRSIIHNVYSIFDYHPQSSCHNHNILFLSGNNIFNQNGLFWFIKEVFPLIRKRFTDTELLIGGSICKVMPSLGDIEGVKTLGYIDNPAKFYSLADVAINPVYQGTGLKIKTFEAISYDKVTIVHPHSMIGVFQKNNAPLMASENPQDWVEFFEKIWNSQDFIIKIKERNKEYLARMNEFIRNEYDSFLNS